ncbi:hypothetical protein CRE_04245 [Caenorhabditis remanei]|uniref:F-box associated domain-containing protein n=1 Tax=Caenorhabditis remanei TaxID=31234 RepID=E3MYX4_CAERE|nr:hypothetical protein CRE_04245 [Caenorhabditis remanei]
MDLQEILLITLTSKKSAFIMKFLLPMNWFNLELLFFSETTKFFFDAKGPSDSVLVEGQNAGDVYQFKIAQHNRDITHHEEFMMGVMDHVKQLNLVKKSIILSQVSMPSANYRHILDECKEVSKLLLFCKVESGFEYRAGPDFRIDYLHVSDGHWMHLDDFSNCKKVKVFDRSEHKHLKYANPEVPRALIRKWIESDCQLEHLEAYGDWVGIDFREVLSGLEYRKTEQREYSHSVEITRRCDGKKATVTCRWNYFELKVID